MSWVSPNELMAAAREHMLDGREPAGVTDAALVMNFLAANIDAEVAESACLLLRRIYPESLGLLDEDFVRECVAFQAARR